MWTCCVIERQCALKSGAPSSAESTVVYSYILEILFAYSFGGGHKVCLISLVFLGASGEAVLKRTCFSATSFTDNSSGHIRVRPELLSCTRLPHRTSVYFQGSAQTYAHAHSCRSRKSRIIQSARSGDGKPCRVSFGFCQRDISRLRPSKLPPQCCGVMTVIIAAFP